MKRDPMKQTIAAVLVGVVMACGAPLSAQSDLSGLYLCEGTSPMGTSYTCAVEIAPQGDIFSVRWRFEQGHGIGIGIRQGDVLSVIFQLEDGSIGLTSYQIAGTTLTGVWTMPGMSTVATETLQKTTATSLDDVSLEPRQKV